MRRQLSAVLSRWPLVQDLKAWRAGTPFDQLGLGDSAISDTTRRLAPRTRDADAAVPSICPYCGVGCAQIVYVKNGAIIDIEGHPRSPINAGTLCPRGAATFGLLVNPARLMRVKYRAPYSDRWEERPLEWAMDRIAELVKRTRDADYETRDDAKQRTLHRCGSIASLGGATLDNEENYLIKKLFGGGLGMVWIENQARV
ncbi:MAG: hypothetical protein FJ027_04640 [Candidatus Rokubacteria bacterium]|nr:hypothetical protein [Candidatus Rokubacteria bacterium]